jgi:hypothetical protein
MCNSGLDTSYDAENCHFENKLNTSVDKNLFHVPHTDLDVHIFYYVSFFLIFSLFSFLLPLYIYFLLLNLSLFVTSFIAEFHSPTQ